jgi:probable HAF family extracellular repeat protein
VGWLAVLVGGAALGQTITSVGLLDGGTATHVYGMSRDGRAVTGWGNSGAGNHAFLWTREGGLRDLGTLQGQTSSFGYAVSNGGSVVVGYTSGSLGTRAFRWTAAGGMENMGLLPGDADSGQSYARGISADSSVIVGSSGPATNQKAFRWTQATGMVSLGAISGPQYFSAAESVSADGSVVVGESDTDFGMRAFRWTAATGMVNLGWQNGWPTQGWNCSPDGLTVVGYGGSVNGSLANRWTQATGIQPIGVLPGTQYSYSYATTGPVIVGASGFGNPGNYTAFRWTQNEGMQDLNSYLRGLGIDLDAWDLQIASDISSDGNVIAGEGLTNGGFNVEGWVVSLVPVCGSADFDCDGDTGTDADIETFFACLAGTCPSSPCPNNADFNGDGDVGTDADIESFFRVLAGGPC